MKENFSKRVQSVMKFAKEEAIRLGHSYVGSEHLLLGILQLKSGQAANIFEVYDCDVDEMRSMIEDMIKKSGGTLTLGHLPLTRRAERILRNAFTEATSLGNKMASDEHLVLSILKESEGIAYEVLVGFNLDYQNVKDLIQQDLSKGISPVAKIEKSKKSKTPALDHFSRDVTELARNGELDPVIGREEEIVRVAQILSRRKKNNPVLIGEPGVGKTAIIEGLAHKIVEKSVPRLLRNKRILSLDLASTVAGTKYRGQFEERMKTLMVELENTDDVILFIDEIHTLVGAGGATGSLDASNMFKPALARGDIHCIGATTMDEYRKSIEKDGALERRFQRIIVNPPSTEESIEILCGLQPNYEKHHNVKYDKEAINACVYLAERYISNRFLPDKAIDVMDEVGSRSHMENVVVPKKIVNIENEIDDLRIQKETKVAEQKFEDAALLRDSEHQLIKKLGDYHKNWVEKEKMNPVRITKQNVADVVALMTGIPINEVAESEGQKLLNMREGLHQYIVGQDPAIDSLTRSIQRARAGLKNPNRPIGVFLFLGPTGVGKTEMAKGLAQYLFSHTNSLIKLDMSEYSERFTVSRLIGAPPGYVGYEEGGDLTEKVRRNPYSVILFDEIEKAHPDVFNLLLQLFDEGSLTDSLGRKIDFKNSIIIMTSNLGTKSLHNQSGMGFLDSDKASETRDIEQKIMEEVKTLFNPEFLNRIDDKLVFHTLKKEHVLGIVDIQLADLHENLSEMGISLTITKRAKQLLMEKGYSLEYGARHLRREIQANLENPISELLLEKSFKHGDVIKISALKYEFIIESKQKRNSSKSRKIASEEQLLA
ncbi:MAG: ATP-dependent Clp protease ATP-binding subunit [Candidatus Marinimicrobia bacterium]|nr:ATP-dependent Clp protease ATP-binding subunit [Candidatus Neomarinimicrobiota bacterium]